MARTKPPSTILDTPFGPIVLDRADGSGTAFLSYRGEDHLFPEPYRSDPDLPVGRFLRGVPGAVVRALASRCSFVWHANDDLGLTVVDTGDGTRIERDPHLDELLEALAGILQSQVDAGPLLHAFADVTDTLDAPIIERAGYIRVHSHPNRETDREAYLGKLAPLGSVNLSTILPEMGYVEAAVLPEMDLPSDFVETEWDHYERGWRRRSSRPSVAWVKPSYAAPSEFLEALAVASDVPAAQEAARTVPVIRLESGPLDAVDVEFGFAFVPELRIVASEGVLAEVRDLLDFRDPEVRDALPSSVLAEISAAEARLSIRVEYVVPSGRADLARFLAEDDILLRLIAEQTANEPSHALCVERYAEFPTPEEVRSNPYLRSSRSYDGKDRLPTHLRPAFDVEAYENAVVQYLQREITDGRHPLIERAREFAAGARGDLLPLLSQMVEEGASPLRPARDALLHAADLLERVGPEDLAREPKRVGERQTLDPAEAIAPPPEWHPLPGGEVGDWEATLLVFALNRDGEALPVPGRLVSGLLDRPQPVALPQSWEWRVGTARFLAVAVARDRDTGVHALGRPARVAGLDGDRGRRCAVVVESGEWKGVAHAIGTVIGVAIGDEKKVLEQLRGSAKMADELPDPADPEVFRYHDEWLPSDLSNRARLLLLERSPKPDIQAEKERFRTLAPRLIRALNRWERLDAMIGGEFFLGGAEVEWYREFQTVPLLTMPENALADADGLLDLEIAAPGIVPLFARATDGSATVPGAEVLRAAWLRETEGDLRLEHGFIEAVDGVVVRIAGEAAPQTTASRERVSYRYRGPETVLVPGHLPADLGPEPTGPEEILRRSTPLSAERGAWIDKWSVSEASLLEAYREAGTYAAADRLLASWGAKVGSSGLGARIREIRDTNPGLYEAILPE